MAIVREFKNFCNEFRITGLADLFSLNEFRESSAKFVKWIFRNAQLLQECAKKFVKTPKLKIFSKL